MNTLLHFLLLLLQLRRSLRNISLGGRILGKSKSLSRLAEYDDVIRGPLFSLASGPQTLNPPLPIGYIGLSLYRLKPRASRSNGASSKLWYA